MSAPLNDLYERDFYVWARKQAAGLMALAATRPNAGVDWPHLIDEVNELAMGYRDACRSQLRRVIEHLLKLEFSPATQPRGMWRREIADARAILDDKLTRTLRADLGRNLPRTYRMARRVAYASMDDDGERGAEAWFPAECPYTLD